MGSNLKLVGANSTCYVNIDELIDDIIQPLLDQDVPALEIDGQLLNTVDFIKESLYDAIENQLEG